MRWVAQYFSWASFSFPVLSPTGIKIDRVWPHAFPFFPFWLKILLGEFHYQESVLPRVWLTVAVQHYSPWTAGFLTLALGPTSLVGPCCTSNATSWRRLSLFPSYRRRGGTQRLARPTISVLTRMLSGLPFLQLTLHFLNFSFREGVGLSLGFYGGFI